MKTQIGKADIAAIVSGLYDLQQLRIMEGNRIVASYRVKLGIQPSQSEDEAESFAAKVLLDLRASYDRITDGIVAGMLPRFNKFQGDPMISNYAELCLYHGYVNLLGQEQQMSEALPKLLKGIPIWDQFLEGVKGCGPMISAIIIAKLDPAKATYPSSFWKYAGLDVAPDGRGRRNYTSGDAKLGYTSHLVQREYINKAGEQAFKMGITYNPFVKTKLLGVLAGSFLKCKNEKYAPIYYDYKNRCENHSKHANWILHPDTDMDKFPLSAPRFYQEVPMNAIMDSGKKSFTLNFNGVIVYYVAGKTKQHRHNMALRYMIKRFLVDLHLVWRAIEGLPVHEEYSVAKLGMIHRKAA